MIAGKSLKTAAKWRLGAALLTAIAGLVPGALAQSNAPAKSSQLQSQRFLIVFETSRGMARRAENSIKTVSNLISSGLNGQMQTGDTLGVWTFNDTLNAGKFPLAKWWSENSSKIAEGASVFLRQQKFEKGANFQQVTAALNKIAETSDRLTVIIVSSGENAISGTQCDEEINLSFKTWRSEQQKARMPFVSVIRASRGEIVGNAITPAPWQAEVPPWPKRLMAAATPAPAVKTNTVTKPKAAPVQAEVKSNPPPVTITTNANALIFTGKKSNAGTAITTAGATTNQVDSSAPLRAAASDNAPTSDGPVQSPVFISAAAITNLAANNAQPVSTPPPTGNANATLSDSAQSGSVLQVHARTLQDTPAAAANNVAPSNKPAQTAAALPPPTVLTRKFVLAVGLGLTAMIGLFLFLRGGGNVRQESLITRSYQRKRK